MLNVFDPKNWPGIEPYDVGQLDFAQKKWHVARPCLPESVTNMTVLDVGCWTGYATLAFAQEGAKASGVDIVEGRLEKARAVSRHWNIPATFNQESLYAVATWLRKPADIVWACGVIHNLPNPRAGLYCVAYAAKTWLVLECRTLDLSWPQINFVGAHKGDYHTHRVCVPSSVWVEAMLWAAGFETIKSFLHFSGDRSVFIARRRAIAVGTKKTNLSALENGAIVELPLTHPAIAAVKEYEDGFNRRVGASTVPSWTALDIEKRFDPALFVPVIWNPHSQAVADGEHRVRAARRLKLKSIRVMCYIGPLSNAINGGGAPDGST